MHVQYIGPFGTRTGYARAGADWLKALIQAGCTVNIVPTIGTWNPDNVDSEHRALLDCVALSRSAPSPLALWHTMPGHAQKLWDQFADHRALKNILVTTWETSFLPEIPGLENFEAIVTPSKCSAHAIEQATDADFPVHVIPHCFDPTWWWEEPPPQYAEIRQDAPFTFYSIGAWTDRKNPMGALLAYLSEFKRSEDVQFCMLTPKHQADEMDAVKLLHHALNLPLDELPEVNIVGKRVNYEQLREIHWSSHCYLSLTRGEAWNLGAFEAALVGNGVIHTEGTGAEEWLNGVTSGVRGVNAQSTPAVAAVEKIVRNRRLVGMKSKAPTGMNAHQLWLEPDLSEASLAMREVFNERRLDSFPGRQLELGQFSYTRVGGVFRDLLESL